jgi:hypothetical protein
MNKFHRMLSEIIQSKQQSTYYMNPFTERLETVILIHVRIVMSLGEREVLNNLERTQRRFLKYC